VPQVSSFFGIAIYLHYDDHPEAHFHAIYGSAEAQIRIADLSLMAGALPPRAMGLVIEWASTRQDALVEDWELAARHLPLKKIAPLK
jgi:hypothetical protein